MKGLFAFLAVACLLVPQVAASDVLMRWLDAINNWDNYQAWIGLAVWQIFGWLAPILAGPIKVIAIDIYALVKSSDTSGLAVPILASLGINGPGDLVEPTFYYLVNMITGFVPFLGIKIDMTDNIVSKLISDPKYYVNKCSSDPTKCGISCTRYPTLSYSGKTCTDLCTQTPTHNMCL